MSTASKWGPLLAGLGALAGSGSGANAHAGNLPARAPHVQDDQGVAETVRLRLEDGRIFLSEHGGSFEEVFLDVTPKAAHLRHLLIEILPTGGELVVPVGPSIVAEGGASGNWGRSKSGRGGPKNGR